MVWLTKSKFLAFLSLDSRKRADWQRIDLHGEDLTLDADASLFNEKLFGLRYILKVFIAIALPVLTCMVVYNLLIGQRVEAALLCSMAFLLLGSYFAMHKFRDHPQAQEKLYRIYQNPIRGFLLIFLAYIIYVAGWKSGLDRVQWSYIFPIVAFLCLSRKEGVFWALLFLTSIALVLFYPHSEPPSLNASFAGFKPRFLLSFSVMCLIGFAGKYGIDINNARLVHRQGKLAESRKEYLEAYEGLHREMEQRQQAQQALAISEEKYRLLFENASDVIYSIDGDLKIISISPSMERYLGYSSDEIVGKFVYDLHILPPEDLEQGLSDILHILKGGTIVSSEYRFFTKDGLLKYGDISGAPILRDGEIIGVICMARDITARKKIERNLKEIITKNPISMQILDKDGCTLEVNPSYKSIFGSVPPSDYSIFSDLQLLQKGMGKLFDELKTGAVVRFPELSFNPHDSLSEFPDKPAWIRTIGFPLYGVGEKPENFVFMHEDITERKKAEAEKLISQEMAGEHKKQALVGQIAGKMAHDFNNILGIIMGNTELAILDCQEPSTKKTLELIYEQTIRGKNLTKNLVAFAKDQEPKQEFFSISEKIELVLNLLKKDLEGIQLRKEESPDVPELLADPGMIEHALVNLIQNSIHALSLVEHPRIIVRAYSRDNHICFEIEDNGCGISQDNLEHIYEPSFTLKGSKDVAGSYKAGIKGTGYGMSNVKKYIEQHKGSISIESESGSGTKFTISLPVIKKELTIEEKTEIRKGKAHFKKYILLVEDETAIADVQYRILTQEPCNHKVDIANKGQVAMDLLGRNKYDLVSLDYVLPGGINGMDIYHHIRLSDKTIPILFISGNIEFIESIKELKQKDTAIDHLSKPCKNIDYVNGINKLFENASN